MANSGSIIKQALGWADDDLKDMATALGLDGDKADVISLKFTAEEWANNKNVREVVAYIGFDPRKIVEQFFKKAEENKASADDVPVVYGNVKIYEKNEAKTDLMFFLNVFLERGNNLHKALMRCDETIGPVLRRKANAYGITTEKTQNKTILGTRHLTLARLAQAFAQCTAAIILKDQVKSKLVPKLLPGAPLLACHTIYPALIPTNLMTTTDVLKDMAVFLNIEMTLLLADVKEKRKMSVRPLEDLYEQSVMFVEAAMSGSLIPDSSRAAVLVKAGILKLSASRKLELTDVMAPIVERLAKVR